MRKSVLYVREIMTGDLLVTLLFDTEIIDRMFFSALLNSIWAHLYVTKPGNSYQPKTRKFVISGAPLIEVCYWRIPNWIVPWKLYSKALKLPHISVAFAKLDSPKTPTTKNKIGEIIIDLQKVSVFGRDIWPQA